MRWLKRHWPLTLLLTVAVLLAGGLAWYALQPKGLGPGFASGNGRVEATDIDIATKIAGRIKDILVDEGDFVTAGEVVAHMDVSVLEAQRAAAVAQMQEAAINVQTAQSLVSQHQAEVAAAQARVAQREAERDAAQRRLARSETLAPRGAVPKQTLDDDRDNLLGAQAAVSAEQANLAAAQAAVTAAQSQVIGARAAVEAARAEIDRIQADIDDSTLRAPREGRVQYRVAQPGEVLPAGGKLLNMIDLSDVYMTFFLPTADAGKLRMGDEARLVLDAFPQYVIPARISLVADVAQFTPKTVETPEERTKLMFRIKARIDPALLKKYIRGVKTGLPGVAYVRLDSSRPWPPALAVKLPQ
ncbi:HlyD family secretion protein [Acidocella sp.]|uniref:HlyD family secretion protein n=1 Tax=Acidocella sp. TaxID=50710 RepID=UPI00260D1FBF|nr:HlyD family efflux transporter periplasmic adaptor subunit [Acidocella sp.]